MTVVLPDLLGYEFHLWKSFLYGLIRELVQSHWKPSVAYLRCANRHSHSVAFPII